MNQLSIFISKNLFILIACLHIISNIKINYSVKLLITLISSCTIILSFQEYMKESYDKVTDFKNKDKDISDDHLYDLLMHGTINTDIMQTNLYKYKKEIKKIDDQFNLDYDNNKIKSNEHDEGVIDSEDEIDSKDDIDFKDDIDSEDDIDSGDDIDSEDDSDDINNTSSNLDKNVNRIFIKLENLLERDKKVAEELVQYKNLYNKNQQTRTKNRLYAAKNHIDHHKSS